MEPTSRVKISMCEKSIEKSGGISMGWQRNVPNTSSTVLGQQVRTAAISLTANIAEGYGRFHFKENMQFCRIARGSAHELLDHVIACHDQGYLDEKEHVALRQKLVRFIQLVNGYIGSIGQSGMKKTD